MSHDNTVQKLGNLCDVELDLTKANEEEAVSLLKHCINNHLILEPYRPL
jgi:dTMP kinase